MEKSVENMINRLKELREERGLSMRDLERENRHRFTTISKIESGAGSPRSSTIEKLALFYKVNPAWLMCLSNQKYPDREIDFGNADDNMKYGIVRCAVFAPRISVGSPQRTRRLFAG